MTPEKPDNHTNQGEEVRRPLFAKLIRILAIPIIPFWVGLAVVTNVFVPPLEETTAANAAPLIPREAPSSHGAVVTGQAYGESNYTSVAVVVMETHGRNLGEQDHRFNDDLVRKLRQDTKHVQSVLDLWGDPVTKPGQQSADSQAATITVRPVGDLGDAAANDSTQSIRDMVDKTPKPSDLTVYVSGPAPLAGDTLNAAEASMGKLTIVTVILVLVMLLVAYRSITRAVVPLLGVLVILAVAKGVVSFFVAHHVIGISSFAMNLLVALVLGATTDYAIFFIGRYLEARQRGLDREDSYYTSVTHTSHVVLGSGLAIIGATLCLSLTRLDYFRTLGPPCSMSMVIAVLGGLTLHPALIAVASKVMKLVPPKPRANPIWRDLGTSMARWPLAMMALAALLIPLLIFGLATYKVSYNDRDFAPANVESVRGYAAADRHFPKSQLSTDILYVQSDHDLRNTTDMIALDRISKNISRVPGISMVQSITRPNARPVEHASLPFAMGQMGTKIGENIGFLRDRTADIDTLAAKLERILETTRRMEALTNQLAVGTHISREAAQELSAATDEMRDHFADFDDFWRPIRSYFYWDKHCFDIPMCWSLRSLFDMTDGFDKLSDAASGTVQGLVILDVVTPQLATQIHELAENTAAMLSLTLALQSTLHSLIPQMESFIHPMVDMAQAFDNAKNDDFFFLAPDSFGTHDMQVGLNFFLTRDGKGSRVIIYHQGEAMSPEGIKQIENALTTAQGSLKGTSLSSAQLYMSGAASNYRDIKDYSRNDIIIMMLATFSLAFAIIVVLTRALIGAIVVLFTVILSFAAAYGLSTFIWERLLGQELYWLTLPIAFIVLVAVGSDYNLLLLSRYKEELGAGVKTGVIRAMGTSGASVITACVVFAVTMLALLTSDVVNVGQAGSTIFVGLLFDMFIVRIFLVMPLARLLGPWFWWPGKLPGRPRTHAAAAPSRAPSTVASPSMAVGSATVGAAEGG
jgi:putative drug exporter of the RND superfamily